MGRFTTALTFATALLAVLAARAEAQDFGDYYDFDDPYWYDSLDAAMSAGGASATTPPRRPPGFFGRRMARTPKKYILAYVHTPGELQPHNVFKNIDLINASRTRGAWCFIKVPFERDNEILKSWGVRAPMTVVAMDIHANPFITTRSLSIGGMRNVLKGLPAMIEKYKLKIASDLKKAKGTLERDKDRGLKVLIKLVKEGKRGYTEIDEATTLLNELAQTEFKEAELAASVDPAEAIKLLEAAANKYEGTPPEAQALIVMARIQKATDRMASAIGNLVKVTKMNPLQYRKEINTAEFLLDEISREGEAEVAKATEQGRDKAREDLRKLMKDYEGTRAGELASEQYRRLD